MVNPATGRTIFKTGALGRKVQKMQSVKKHKTATSGRVKSKPKAKAKTSQTSPSPSAKRPASAPPWARGLVDACARPDSTAGVIRHDDRLVVMRDKYPKGETHLLVLARGAEFADARGVAALEPRHAPLVRAMLAAGREAVADLKRNKNEHAAAAAAEGAAAADRAPERSSSGSASLFRLGFHAKPSMPQLHMHVVSQDLRGAGMKTRRHWGSFATAFFVDAEAVLRALEGEGGSGGGLALDPEAAEAELRMAPLRCHKCGDGPHANAARLFDHVDRCPAKPPRGESVLL